MNFLLFGNIFFLLNSPDNEFTYFKSLFTRIINSFNKKIKKFYNSFNILIKCLKMEILWVQKNLIFLKNLIQLNNYLRMINKLHFLHYLVNKDLNLLDNYLKDHIPLSLIWRQVGNQKK